MTPPVLSRRQLLLGSVALQLFGALPAEARGKSGGSASGNGDHGIGGSGLSVHGSENEDHGIGGTGIVGTIQGFGSIIVNGVHIPFTRKTPVTIDGKRVWTQAMQIGHVVRVLLDGNRAKRIAITSEVLGRIDRIGALSLSIRHQRIATHGLDTRSLKVGDVVAVFGIRKPDGKIIARRIEPRPAGTSEHVRGVVMPRGMGVSIGGLSLGPRYLPIAGRLALVRFQSVDGHATIARVSVEPLVPGLKRGIVNVETYGHEGSRSLVLGIGRFPPRGPMRFGPGGHAFADIVVRDGGRRMDFDDGMRPDFGPSGGPGLNGTPGGPPPDGRPFGDPQFNGAGPGPSGGAPPGGPPPGGPPPGGPPPGGPRGFGGPGGPSGPPSGPSPTPD